MNSINFKRQINGQVEEVAAKITESLKPIGFGILTRIDFHSKIKEKLNKDIPATVILGACNPALAYEGFQRNTDFTSLIPCNVVVRDLGQNRVSVEMAKPTAIVNALGDQEMVGMAKKADEDLQSVLNSL